MPSLATSRKIVFVASFLVVVTVITIAVEIYNKRQNLGLIGDSFSVYPPEWFAPINDPQQTRLGDIAAGGEGGRGDLIEAE